MNVANNFCQTKDYLIQDDALPKFQCREWVWKGMWYWPNFDIEDFAPSKILAFRKIVV
jgi:hypothetical protein